jgi:hypothetical protein
MIRNKGQTNLEEALAFQISFAQEVCKAMESHFKNYDVVSCFKILSLIRCLPN